MLRPAKEEQLLDEPALFLFHDILNDNDIKEIKALASPRVRPRISPIDTLTSIVPIDGAITRYSRELAEDDHSR